MGGATLDLVARPSDLVYFEAAQDALNFHGRLRKQTDADDVTVHLNDLVGVTAGQLRGALRDAAQYWGEYDRWVTVADTDRLDFDEDYVLRKPYEFRLGTEGASTMTVRLWTREYESLTLAALRRLLKPLLTRHSFELQRLEEDENGSSEPPYASIAWFTFQPVRRSMSSVVEGAEDISALLEAFETGDLTRTSARDLLLAGHAQSLVGQVESDWLEVKTTHYDLDTLGGKVDLASAVARFANSPGGGLVVIGARTKRNVAGERIAAITPTRRDAKNPRRYRHILEEHLYPPIEQLRIDAVKHEAGELLVVDVPPQPEESKPFLVHGAIVGARGEGRFISIVRRSEDESIHTTAAMIHSTIAAGRALLRGK